MDLTTLFILGGLAIAILVAALVVLNRSWGNFPDHAGSLPPAGPSAPGASSQRNLPPLEAPPVAGTPESPPDGGLVLIEHPMVRRAAEDALRRGGPMTRYIVRDGDQVYFSFDQIDDPVQRQAAYDLMRRFQAGQDVDLRAMMRLIGKISKGE
jgi:hypothetical protein